MTAERTAATTALAVDLLARPAARNLAVIGLGPLGRAHLRHARLARPFDQVRVFSPDPDEATVASLGDGVMLSSSVEQAVEGADVVLLSSSVEQAVEGADVVLLCTSAAEPVVDILGLPAGTLITSISTNAPLAHEIAPEALPELDVYCDYTPACLASVGEMRIAADRFGFGADHVRGDLAGLVSGSAPAPSGARPVFFRSVGLGIEDAAVALAVLDGGAV